MICSFVGRASKDLNTTVFFYSTASEEGLYFLGFFLPPIAGGACVELRTI